ncbi:MAG: hypothetical protein C4533_07110 [Candidatus Omnitrophota bacterium]|jgi:hypothetical protein|nr:MAG: hypothetical protein C4533_07110 [Candidatus Omnitrophota bacterium]
MSLKISQEIKFHKDIYPKRAIEDSSLAFGDFFESRIKKTGSYFVVDIKGYIAKDREQEIINEFKNYVLAEAKRCL